MGGVFLNHCIPEVECDPKEFSQSEMVSEIKVRILTVQEYQDGLLLFKIIIAHPQFTNESGNENNKSILYKVDESKMFAIYWIGKRNLFHTYILAVIHEWEF